MRVGSLVLLCLWSATLQAQDAPAGNTRDVEALHAEVVDLYSFAPGTLPQKEMEAKSALLDAFWTKVQSDPGKYGPALRHELAREDAPGFFLYDGSVLLLKLDPKRPADRPVDKDDARLALASLSRCTLTGIDQADYLRKVHWLAGEDNDTTAAAFHILDDPKFQAYISQHALRLGQDYSLLVMLMPIDEALYVPAALKRLETERDEKACASLLKLLWYAAMESGDAAIQQASQDEARPKAVRDAAAKLMLQSMAMAMKFKDEERAKMAGDLKVKADASVAHLKALRAKRMADPISDEALADLDHYTILIRTHAP